MWQLAALRPVGSMITPYVRGVFRGGLEGCLGVGGRAGRVGTESAIE